MKQTCINCLEYSSIEIINGIGICRDPECIFIHNTISPSQCICCGDSLPSHIIHEYCSSSKYRNTLYLKNIFNTYNKYREMGDISNNG